MPMIINRTTVHEPKSESETVRPKFGWGSPAELRFRQKGGHTKLRYSIEKAETLDLIVS